MRTEVLPSGVVIPEGGGRLALPKSKTFKEHLEVIRGTLKGLGLLMAGFSNAAEIEVLDSVFGDHASINLYAAPTYLALTTVAVAETDTGSTITEAGYTGYGRKSVAAADMSAASAGSKSNGNGLTFAACTASSSTVIGWAEVSALTTGTVILFGTCTSTVISTTQTPPTIAVGALAASLD